MGIAVISAFMDLERNKYVRMRLYEYGIPGSEQ